jgi:hypothetical protein
MPQSRKPSKGLTGNSNKDGNGSLRDEVREALRSVLADRSASAAAKASAGRTLLEFFVGPETDSKRGRGASELTLEELDEEIAHLTSQRS